LRHGTIVAKLFRIVANEVPARQLEAANLSQHFFSIHRLKVFLLGLVRNGSKRHLPTDERDSSVSQAHRIAGTDNRSRADSRSVDQIRLGNIGSEPDGSVVAACGVTKERTESAGGVEVPRGVVTERTGSTGGVEAARGVVNERTVSAGGVEAARGVATERIDSDGGIDVTIGVATERVDSDGGVDFARGV
jgi:hypothetical protein